MNIINNFFGHLKTINHHKWLVTRDCIRVGLVRQGLMHDLSKYSPVEFLPGVKYYDAGKRSPIKREKEEKGYSQGWLHHKGRNRHHFEYWLDYSTDPQNGIVGVKMPKRYVAEMVIDRISASRNYEKERYTCRSAWNYYAKTKESTILHPETRFLLEYLLKMTAVRGEDYTYSYMKKRLLKHRYRDYHVVNGKLVLD